MNDPIILSYDGQSPTVHPNAWVASGAVVSGDVQDGAVCHVNFGDAALEIGDDVSVGHGAVLHGCTLESGCLVGIGARVLDRAAVGRQSLVAAGSVVREGTRIPAGELWAGAPASRKRDLSDEEKKGLIENAAHYVELSRHYAGRK